MIHVTGLPRYLSCMTIIFIVIGFSLQLGSAADLYLWQGLWREGSFEILGLHHLVNGRILQIDLPPTPFFARFVVTDPEARLCVVGGNPGMPSVFELMQMDEPGRFRQFEINVPNLNVGRMSLADLPDASGILAVELLDLGHDITLPAKEQFRILDLGTYHWRDDAIAIYQHIRLTGAEEGFRASVSEAFMVQEYEGGQIVLPIGQQVLKVGPPLPLGLRFDAGSFAELLLSNRHFLAIGPVILTPGGVIYRILDKRANEWFSLATPGNLARNVRAFGPWMAGLAQEMLKPGEFKLSPGRHRPPAPTERHPVEKIDDYLLDESLYRPGILFLYDVEHRRYYQWDTHDGDSEVLLVERGEVYYRVDRRIYRAKIGDKELGKPELVVEDDVIPGVHWAFFGPSAAKQVGRRK